MQQGTGLLPYVEIFAATCRPHWTTATEF